MNERELGPLEARVSAVDWDLKHIRTDTREIRDALLTVRGGRKALLLLIGVSASAGGAFATWLPGLFK